MSQSAMHNIQTKNLDKFIDNQIESISSDYAPQHPLPHNDYYDNHSKKKKSKLHRHEPIPNIQILGHTSPPKPKPPKPKTDTHKKPHKFKRNTNPRLLLHQNPHSVSTTTLLSGHRPNGRPHSNVSITPPPATDYSRTHTLTHNRTQSAHSASPPMHSMRRRSHSNPKNGYTHRQRQSPPLTSNIAQIEQGLQTYTLTSKSPIYGYDGTQSTNPQNIGKAKKILGLTDTRTRFSFNEKKEVISLKLNETNESMNKNNSNSICSIESLEADDGTGCNNRGRNTLEIREMRAQKSEIIVESDMKSESESELAIHSLTDEHTHKPHKDSTNTKPKIRMWNALAYGLEDPVEGKTFEWVDSKYVRLLQLSTYSTVMGPKVKFVWKNTESYNLKSILLQKQMQRQCGNRGEREEEMSEVHRTVRPEFAYHELEAWIAKQTLDCTGWKNKHNKTAPPPFTKKTMIAPEFGVVLCCIQFDSSLRALRNKQFHQYINGIYSHTPAQMAHHTPKGGIHGTPKSMRTPNKTPTKSRRDARTPNKNMGRGFNYKNSGIAPTLSPYDHTGGNDSPPNLVNSSSYTSPGSSYRPVGDTLADYLAKFAPFSFSAGLSGGMNVSGADIPQVPYNHALQNNRNKPANMYNAQPIHAPHSSSLPNMHHIDDNEDPDDVGHYSLVLAVEHQYSDKFIECLDAIEHWLYMIASQIRYLLALNKCFKCDRVEHSLKLNTDFNALDNGLNDSFDDIEDGDCPDRLHSIIPFMTNIAPTAIFKFDQLFSATFCCKMDSNDEEASVSMSSSYLMSDPRDGMIYNMNYIPSRGLPARISLFETWFTSPLDNRDKHKLSIMISSHLQTLARTVIIGDDEQEIDRYISTLALFSTSQQKSLSRLSVKVDNPNNLSAHYIPELYLQGIVIPTIKAPEQLHMNNSNHSVSEHMNESKSNSDNKSLYSDSDYAATVAYLQSAPAVKQLQEELYLAPGPSTLVLLTSSKHVSNSESGGSEEEAQSFWWIRQTEMPHKFKHEQQAMLFQKLFYLRRRNGMHTRDRRNSCSYVYRNSHMFESPSRIKKTSSNNIFVTPPNNDTQHHRTLARKNEKEKENSDGGTFKSDEFTSMNKIYRSKKALNEDYEHTGDTLVLHELDSSNDNDNGNGDNDSVTNTSAQSGIITNIQSSLPMNAPQPIHAPHLNVNGHKDLTFVEPSLSPMIATVVFGSFNIPQELKMTFLETQFRILLEKASEILLYIEHEQKDLLSFYDKTCHVMSCKEFKEQVPMEALYPQIMQKFESQLRSDLQINRQEDLYVLLSISEGFRPNLFSLMFGNPVFDIEVADILRYFLF